MREDPRIVTTGRDIDSCIDRLTRAVGATGVAVPDVGGNVDALTRLEEEIAPLRMPAALRRLWERVAPSNLPVGPWPESSRQFGCPVVADPAFAFYAWTCARDFPGIVPEALVAVAFSPPVFRFVELATAGTAGRSAGGPPLRCSTRAARGPFP
jgi:hypothetical protein